MRMQDEIGEMPGESSSSPQRASARGPEGLILYDQANSIYPKLLYSLTRHEYDVHNAKRLWREVLEHVDKLCDQLGRNVGIRVAALDYFTNIQGVAAKQYIPDPAILEQLYRDAIIDPLTGLPNRRHYMERFAAEVHRSIRYRDPFVLVLFDLDDFKAVNDTRGHTTGDRILRKVADCLLACLRDSDMAARWGGEEFVLLLPRTDKDSGLSVADRVRRRVQEDLAVDGVTISGGIAACPTNGEDEESLFSFADRGLYRAKSEGKNRICSIPQERRAFRRLDTSLKVRIRPAPNGQDDSVDTKTSNIGAGGIAFFYDEPPTIATEVYGEIQIDGRTPRFRGHIARVEELPQGGYEIGLEFIEISSEDRDLIMTYTTAP